ncbi:protein maelstrom homolog [Oppia nitens]|uniref:protein maelstrom homolog n=1 Tax=Oppia nitens TaxID=1686743 RepID=UPI0023D9BE8A|nr:protein maelstrom homolog [Oppia nitens]XP_054159485.1 protein maelstrom homolog [Oppia nitens]
MGKSKGRNAFFHFLIHIQNQMKKEGKNFGLNNPELQTIAGDLWKDMPKEERQPFELMSQKEKSGVNSSAKVTIDITPKSYKEQKGENFGRSAAMCSANIDDEQSREEFFAKLVESFVKSFKSKTELMDAPIFIVGTNIMIRTESYPSEYYPLEIGISRYTIREGIHCTYHEFIDAGKVPIGYMHMANDWSKTSHKIPLDNFDPAVSDYKKLVEDIEQILEESRFTNPVTGKPTSMLVFCREDAVEQNAGVFRWLAQKYQSVVPGFEWDVEFLDLVTLVWNITNFIERPISQPIAENKLTSSTYDYSPNTNCEFHDEQDNYNCAQGLTRRLSYILTDMLCPLFEIRPTERHLPPKINVVVDAYMGRINDVNTIPIRRFNQALSLNDNNWSPNDDNDQQRHHQSERPDSSASSVQRRPQGIGRGRAVWKK